MEHKEFVFSKNVVEFVTVGVEYCRLLENASECDRNEFIDRCIKILPLLYLKATLLPVDEVISDDLPEDFVTEEAYGVLANTIASILGDKDDYLETFHPEMRFSDTPIIANISEDLADIYQDIKNLAAVYSIGYEPSMHDALLICRDNFASFWGQKLVNVLGALHHLRFDMDESDESEESGEARTDWFNKPDEWNSNDIDDELKNWE